MNSVLGRSSESIDSDAEDKTTRANVKRAGLVDNKVQDLFCLVVFALVVLGWIIIWVVAATQGDPGRLVHGIDYTGNTCGSNAITAGNQKALRSGVAGERPSAGNPCGNQVVGRVFYERKKIAYPRTNLDMILNKVNSLDGLINPIPDFLVFAWRNAR